MTLFSASTKLRDISMLMRVAHSYDGISRQVEDGIPRPLMKIHRDYPIDRIVR